jgi:hypothetical protein
MKTLWNALDDAWKAVASLVSAFAAGAAFVFVLGGFAALPAEVEAIDNRVTELEEYVERVDQLVCLLVNEKVDRPATDCIA